MPTLKERIQSLTSSINEAKTSLRDALRNKGVDPGSQPSFEAIRLGIEGIPSGDKYKELIGKGSILVPSWILMKPLEGWLWLQIHPQSP
jgi:hypothetical protein